MGQIKQKRESIGLSTTELAHRLGVSQSTALRLEKSEDVEAITLASLKRAARALGMELRYEFVDPPGKGPKPSKPHLRSRVRVSDLRRTGALSGELTERISKRALKLSPLERLKEACELSDLVRELRRV